MDAYILFGISSLIGSIVWGLRLEGRVNAASQKIEDKDEVYNTKVNGLRDLINTQFSGVDNRLERIERALNGSIKGSSHD